MTTINEDDESGDISSTTTPISFASPTQVDILSATDDDNDDVDADTPSVSEIPTTAGQRSCTHYPERNKDLPSATISAENLKLDTVYGDHVHKNSRSHIHGGVGAGERCNMTGATQESVTIQRPALRCSKRKRWQGIHKQGSEYFGDCAQVQM